MNSDENKHIVEKIMAELLDEIKKYDQAVSKQLNQAELNLILNRKDELLKKLTAFYLENKKNKRE